MDLERYFSIVNSLPKSVRLVAVSKGKSEKDIELLFQNGQKIFGENRVQELKKKYENLTKDITWHYIGHLQKNNVKYIAPFVHLIHSVDSFSLLTEINRQAVRNNRIIPCLLQFFIAQEETKFGFSLDECEIMLKSNDYDSLKNIDIQGVMGMGTFTLNREQTRTEFQHLVSIFQHLKSNYFSNNSSFKEISMGMTDDYPIAIEEGSTLLRIGSAIFGAR